MREIRTCGGNGRVPVGRHTLQPAGEGPGGLGRVRRLESPAPQPLLGDAGLLREDRRHRGTADLQRRTEIRFRPGTDQSQRQRTFYFNACYKLFTEFGVTCVPHAITPGNSV